MEQKRNRLKIAVNSPVILGFSGVCLAVLILNYLTQGQSNRLLFCVYRSSLFNPLTYLRLFTHVFGHASLEHFVNNIMLLLIVGPLLEEKYGSGVIALMILVTAFVTGVVHCLFFPGTALLGASGVVFALILLSSFTSIQEGTIPLTFILVAVFYIGQQVLSGVFVQDNVSNLTHILGGVVGAAVGFRVNYPGKSAAKPS